MECAYFEKKKCRSCTLMHTPYDRQLQEKQEQISQLLATTSHCESMTWLPPVPSQQTGFRTKAKMGVGGTWQNPTLGILDKKHHGVDLEECMVLDPIISDSLHGINTFITRTRMSPYDVNLRRGELKYVVVTSAESGGLMVRFVLRSRRHVSTIQSHLHLLQNLVPHALVVTVNIHPIHAATLEGPEEITLTQESTLPMEVGDVVLHLGPRSFSQTNTRVASSLYRQVGQWASSPPSASSYTRSTSEDPIPEVSSLWDLYCGIGGFSLHAAHYGVKHVTGVEISEQAIDSAQYSAVQMGLSTQNTTFIAGDATNWAYRQPISSRPDVIIVNPPRRGIGRELAQWLNTSGIDTIIYSSCNPVTLCQDLRLLTHYSCNVGRIFDMFAHTHHCEVAVLLKKNNKRTNIHAIEIAHGI